MKDDWENPYEEDGVTLGPEEALLRETEKTKALKVEKLQLKDTIEKLRNKNNALANVNNSLEQKLRSLTEQSSSSIRLETDQTHTLRWAYLLLIFNLTALIILILFHIKQ
jgi:predicted RNase H-like nuclease (RuvC/YqgF family)